MVSYGGKIQPRTHDNQLAYVGGETKILAVDRSVKFSSLIGKLSSLIAEDSSSSSPVSLSSFKYQLPGEDLDALISVTNDDDLDHMMHEYDRLYRGSSRPARLRLFAFPVPTNQSGFGSGSSEPGKLDRDRFVEALNSVTVPVPEREQPTLAPVPGNNNNVDFLFGLDNRGPVHVVKLQDPVHHPDPQIDARIQELNRLQISAQDPVHNPAGPFAGDAYQKPPPTIPASLQMPPPSYWQPPPPPQPTMGIEHQPPPPQQHQQQPVYMIHAPPPANMYHAPVARTVAGHGHPPQGYYHQVQRMPSDPVYREQPVYNVAPPPPLSAPQPPPPAKVSGYSDGMGVPVRTVAGLAENTGGYQVAYDSATGRQVYYAAPGPGGAGLGVVTAPFQAVGGGDVIRPAGGLTTAEGKVVTKL